MNKPIYLLITWIFPSPTSWRGAFAYDYAKAIERDGRYRLVVFKAGSSYDFDGVKVHGFKTLSAPSGIPFPPFWWLNWLLFAKALRTHGINPKDIAVVDAFANGLVNEALVVKKLNSSVKLLTHHHDLASFGISVGRFRHFYPFKFLNFFHMRRIQEAVDVHVFISEAVKKSFLLFPDTSWTCYDDYRRISLGLQCFRGALIKNGYVLHNGVDTRIFNNVEAKNGRQRGSIFTIGCIGNFVGLKDQMTLLRAVEMMKGRCKGEQRRVKIIFVGSGPELESCKKFAAEKGLEVEFRTEVYHEQLADFYRSLDLFVLPSYFEGFGCVFTEAWACGTPFITCEGQGMDDLIREEDRALWLARPRDPEDLAQKIAYFIRKRPEQVLRGEVAIGKLVPQFLDWLDCMEG